MTAASGLEGELGGLGIILEQLDLELETNRHFFFFFRNPGFGGVLLELCFGFVDSFTSKQKVRPLAGDPSSVVVNE